MADLDGDGLWHTDLLSHEERARAERFGREHDGQRWARAHGLLRVLLGEYLRADPRALRFATGIHGKPELLDSQGLCFNLAHSGGLALYAVAYGRPVGVDVEVALRQTDVLAVAARAFGPTTAARLGGLDSGAREREFLREWVRHEAALKCEGTGLGGGHTRANSRRLWLAELDLGCRATAVLATMGEPTDVTCREWPA
jgi:4'-phosphopantetheinyl transferase